MKLENQVCSLELAKRLKELGVKQDSCFYWGINDDIFQPTEPDTNKYVVCSAFTVAELVELSPPTYSDGEMGFNISKGTEGYMVSHYDFENETTEYEENSDEDDRAIIHDLCFEDVVLPNALAKMLCYLLENKLIEL